MNRTAEVRAAVDLLLNRGHLQNHQHHGYTKGHARKDEELVAYARPLASYRSWPSASDSGDELPFLQLAFNYL